MDNNIKEMSYSDFCEYLDGDGYDRFESILAYDEFCVYKDKETNKYYYLEGGENDACDFFEVIVVARLIYDINHDINQDNIESLFNLFECCCCGEYVTDDKIEYLWFEEIKSKEDI